MMRTRWPSYSPPKTISENRRHRHSAWEREACQLDTHAAATVFFEGLLRFAARELAVTVRLHLKHPHG